jgi:hypothetical protein
MDVDLLMEQDMSAGMVFDLGPDGEMPPPATPLSDASQKRVSLCLRYWSRPCPHLAS